MEFNLITLATFEEVIGGFGDFVNQYLIPDPIMFLIQLCSTAVIFIVVSKFFFKPVREILKKRQEHIANQLKDSEEAKKKALEHENTSKQYIEEAKKESNLIIEQAKRQAELHKEKTLKELDEEIKQMKLRTQEEIEREKQAAVEDIKKQIVDVALQASEVVLNREVNQDDNTRLVNDFIKDIVN